MLFRGMRCVLYGFVCMHIQEEAGIYTAGAIAFILADMELHWFIHKISAVSKALFGPLVGYKEVKGTISDLTALLRPFSGPK